MFVFNLYWLRSLVACVHTSVCFACPEGLDYKCGSVTAPSVLGRRVSAEIACVHSVVCWIEFNVVLFYWGFLLYIDEFGFGGGNFLRLSLSDLSERVSSFGAASGEGSAVKGEYGRDGGGGSGEGGRRDDIPTDLGSRSGGYKCIDI